MRTDFTAPFALQKNSRSNEPVTLLQLDWPAAGNLPALTLRLADREGVVIGGVPWYPLIDDPGDIRRLVDSARLTVTPSTNVRIGLVNLKTDLFTPPAMFSSLFRSRPPENAVATIRQWFGSLDDSDIVDLFVGSGEDPIQFNEVSCGLNLVNISTRYGRTMIGNVIGLDNYPLAPDGSVGKVLPIVLGVVEDAPSILVRKTAETKLRSVALPGTNILDVADTADFPASGTVIINDDEVAYTSTNSTQLLGCTGINEFHYADDVVLEKNTDHRYLFSDPTYAIQSISAIKIEGHLAEASLYTVDLAKCEVVFGAKPVGSTQVDTKFLQAQNDALGAGNTAVDPLNATAPSQTSYAKISQTNSVLSLTQTDSLPNIGVIGKVLLRVEHFVEEKLPNDSLTAHVTGVGQVGTLSAPAVDDVVISSGTTDITHTHLDTFGFPISDPQHFHTSSVPLKVTQNAIGGVSEVEVVLTNGNFHTITFPDPGAGAWATAEYSVGFEFTGTYSGPAQSAVQLQKPGGSPAYTLWTYNSGSQTYTTAGNLNVASNTVQIDIQNITTITFKIKSAIRIVTFANNPNTDTKSTSTSTSKTGALTQHGSSPALSATTESATRSVVDFFDITSYVDGDWNWFTNRESQIHYNGASDGRTAFIVHLAYEIEYARRRIEFTDAVTATVEGVVDDGAGSATGTPDLLIEKPHHLFKWSILKALGLDASVLDNTSIDSAGALMDAAIAGGYKFGGILQDKTEARALWQKWGKECRSYFFWDLGKARALYRPLNSVTPETPVQKAIADWMIPREESTGVSIFETSRTRMDNLVNHIDMQYRRDWSGDEYFSNLNKVETGSVSAFGKREMPDDFKFDFIRADAMADHVAEFYINEHSKPTDIYEFELFLDNMELERGDTVWANPPTHDLDNVKVMVLGAGRVLGSGKARRMDKVMITGRLIPGKITRPGFGHQAFGLTGFGGVHPDAGFGNQSFGSTGFGGIENV